MDAAFISDQLLDQLPLPAQVGRTRVGGVDLNKPRLRAALSAVLALAPAPNGFMVGQFLAKVQRLNGQTACGYGPRQAAYDLKKLRGKHLITKLPASRRYQAPPEGLRSMAALLLLRDQVIQAPSRRRSYPSRTWQTQEAECRGR